MGASIALPLIPGCRQAPTAAPASEADAKALLDSIGENLLNLSPESATSLGIDTGKRAALRSQLSRPLAGRAKRGSLACCGRTWNVPQAIDVSGLSARDPHQRRGRAQRLSHRARRLRPALWRRRRRRLAQHALCRHPECRRLSRRAALPRHRPPGRKCRRRRSLSGAARKLSRPARRRAWADEGGRAARADRRRPS